MSAINFLARDAATNPNHLWLTGKSLAGGIMTEFNAWQLYVLGASITAMIEWLENEPERHGPLIPYPDFAVHLNVLIRNDQLELTDTKEIAASLVKVAAKINYAIHSGGGHHYDEVDLQRLARGIDSLQDSLRREIGREPTWLVEPVGGYRLDLLVDKAERLLPADVRPILDEADAVVGMREAGRCLAFGVATSAGFHLFGVVEAVVKLYFPILGLTFRPSDRNLGKYIDELEKKDVDAGIIAKLRDMKDARNPIIHAEVRLTPGEAETLFSSAMTAIGAVARDIAQRKPVVIQ